MVAALCLILFILVGSPLISRMPMAPLVGLMFMVAIGTFEWAGLKIIRKVPKTDVVVMCLVTGVTVLFHNLAVAFIIGVVISALAFAWESAKRIRARKYLDADGVKHYEFYGPLFFGSVGLFQEKFDVRNDPAGIVIDFKESRIVDHSAIEAINRITERYSRAGKKLHLRHLSEDCRTLLDNAASCPRIGWSHPRAWAKNPPPAKDEESADDVPHQFLGPEAHGQPDDAGAGSSLPTLSMRA